MKRKRKKSIKPSVDVEAGPEISPDISERRNSASSKSKKERCARESKS